MSLTEDAIDAPVLRAMRDSLSITQAKFWAPFKISRARGGYYETGLYKVPAPVQRLVYLHYVIGIPTDADENTLRSIARFHTQRDAIVSVLKAAEHQAMFAGRRLRDGLYELGAEPEPQL